MLKASYLNIVDFSIEKVILLFDWIISIFSRIVHLNWRSIICWLFLLLGISLVIWVTQIGKVRDGIRKIFSLFVAMDLKDTFYLTLWIIILVFLGYKASFRVYSIAPFEISCGNFPVSGKGVASLLEDAISYERRTLLEKVNIDVKHLAEKYRDPTLYQDFDKPLEDSITEERMYGPVDNSTFTVTMSSEAHSPDDRFVKPQRPVRYLSVDPFITSQRFGIEVKGISYESLLSFARKLLGNQITINGDIIGDSKETQIVTRSDERFDDYWKIAVSSLTIEQLDLAIAELARRILYDLDPSYRIVKDIYTGNYDGAYTKLKDRNSDKLDDDNASVLYTLLAQHAFLTFAHQKKQEGYDRSYDIIKEIDGACRDRSVRLLLAKSHLLKNKGKDYNETLRLFRSVYLMNMTDPEVLEQYGNALLLSRHTKDARSKFRRVLAKKHGDVKSLVNIGNTYANEKRFDQALDYYYQAISMQENLAIAYFNASSALSSQGKYDAATSSATRALDLAPNDQHIVWHLLGLYLRTKDPKYSDQVIKLTNSVLEYEKDNGVLYGILANTLLNIGKIEEARIIYTQALKTKGLNFIQKAYVLNALANIYWVHQDYNRTLEISKQVLDVDKDNAIALHRIGHIYKGRGDYKASLNYYEKAYQTGYRNINLLGNYAESLVSTMEFDKALEIYKVLLEADPQNIYALTAISNIYIGRYDDRQVIQYLTRAIKLDPYNVESLTKLARAFSNVGDYIKSIDMLSRAIDSVRDPDGKENIQEKLRYELEFLKEKRKQQLELKTGYGRISASIDTVKRD